eukprot:jgi/Psemu1/262025/estExt_Genewise1Plus.C_6660020
MASASALSAIGAGTKATLFTEAVPLSLNSMAHTAIPLEDGVLDGLKTIVHHTLWSSLSYARAAFGQNFSPTDLCTTNDAWKAKAVPLVVASVSSADSSSLLSPSPSSLSSPLSLSENPRWTDAPGALAKITLLYAATGELTPEELETDTNDGGGDYDSDEAPPPPPPKHVVLYQATTEYRSLPATGNKTAKKAEELSMLSFGGSLVDDDVKYGALAGLYDDHAKYVLEIFGVRGKKYRLDLMDATLSDGTVPSLPSRTTAAPIPHDPFVKTLCVTVSDHEPILANGAAEAEQAKSGNITTTNNNNNNNDGHPEFALTQMRLSLEGDLRRTHLLDATDLPAPNYYPSRIKTAFLSLRSPPPVLSPISSHQAIVTSTPSGHRLLLDPAEAGKIYIHGRYVTTWGKDPRIGGAMYSTALFGMDLHSVPYFHGRIVDYDKLMIAYATLWTEILTDARLVSKNIGGRLLSRLITGKDPFVDDDGSDSDDDSNSDSDDSDDDEEEEETRVNTDLCSLESQVMASARCDPVGISAKALATKFQNEYGFEGYPCLAHELEWVKDRLPGRVPVAVPQRLIDVLRRGGFFDVKRTSEEVWFSESRPATPGTDEETLVQRTCALLEDAGCTDVKPSSIVFGAIPIDDPVRKKALVRLHRLLRQYHVHEDFLALDPSELARGESGMVEDDDDAKPEAAPTQDSKEQRIDALALVLGMHIAREHPDGTVGMRYMLKHMVASKK